MRLVLKIVHNEHIALLWAVAVEILVHGFFGLQAFLLGGFLGEVALVKVFGPDLGQEIGAWSLGILIFGMAFVSFVLGEYLKAHVQSYIWAGKGGQEYMNALKETARMAIGLELSSLAFRVLTVGVHEGDWASAIVIAIAGCIGLRYAVMMAKVIHASVNRDPAHDLVRSQDNAKMVLAEKGRKATKHMSPQELAGWSEGDPDSLQSAYERMTYSEDQKMKLKDGKKQAKVDEQQVLANGQRQWAERMERARGFFSKVKHNPTPEYVPFTTAQSNHQADHLSHNGHRN